MSKCVETECLEKATNYREVTRIAGQMANVDMPNNSDYIPMENFIIFLAKIPLKLWAETPVFYYKNNTWDALGFLGERTHSTTLRTKYLELCFRKVGLKITEVLDNEHYLFTNLKNNKERFLAALHYVEDNITEKEMTQLYNTSRVLCDEENYLR